MDGHRESGLSLAAFEFRPAMNIQTRNAAPFAQGSEKGREAMARKLALKLEASQGTINRFYAFVDHKRVIAAEGTDKPEWSGNVPDSGVQIRLRIWGIGSATFKLSLDLPGTANDQNLELQLDGGYHESDYTI